ncbi:FGGY-family carbohydrate kinase [Shigella flexneri]
MRIPVVAVASHDTASAGIASPLNGSRAAYLFWHLVIDGLESQTPFTNDTALAANITNEGGAEVAVGSEKYYGLMAASASASGAAIQPNLAALISATQHFRLHFIINPNDNRFINPQTMCSEIQAACGKRRNRSRKVMLNWRCIFDSLALLYADVLHELAQLRGEDFSQLHIVGGGCQNTLLNQLCADACGIRVIAGPVEASTLGNIGIELMTLDELNNVDDFRQVVSTTANLTTFTPNPDSEIAHYVAQIHSTRQTKELCA